MSTTYRISIDKERCIGCFACEVACKQEYRLPVGPRLIQVVTSGPKMVGRRLRMDFVPMVCTQCGDPACLNACPEDAIYKREDGIVLIDEDACTGCKLCIDACPLGAMQYLPEKSIAVKCTYCAARIDTGKLPSCVLCCPTHALRFGDVNEGASITRKRRAERIVREASYI